MAELYLLCNSIRQSHVKMGLPLSFHLLNMAAPLKNQFWMKATATGRPQKIQDKEELWKLACEYFEQSTRNPLKEQKVFANGKRMTVKVMRAFTLRALLIYLDISDTTWYRYRNEEEFKDFREVIKKIEDIIYVQKFEGAAGNLLNGNIIARDLGLKDASTVTFTKVGKDLADESYE